MNAWISVQDRMPDLEKFVLCYGNNQIFIGYLHSVKDTIYWCSTDYDHTEWTIEYEPVSHWMPLPEPPSETL